MATSDFNPVTAFNHGEHFRAALGVLSTAKLGGSLTAPVIKDIPTVPYPELVMGFMGTEFYLKSVLRSLGLNVGDHHDLWRLYSAVRPTDHKEAIRLYYSDVIAQRRRARELTPPEADPLDFDASLKAVGDLFNVLRYIYEEGRTLPTGRHLNVGLAMEAVRRYAMELLIQHGKLYYLLAAVETDADGEAKPIEGGERLPINRDTPDLRRVLRERFFDSTLQGDTFSISDLNLVILDSESSPQVREPG